MKQHRSVTLHQYVTPNLDDSVGANADEVLVKRCVMELAKGKAVRNVWFSAFLVTYDVRGVEEFTVPQAANCALGLVGAKNSLAKRVLVKAHFYLPRRVAASFLPYCIRCRRHRRRKFSKVDLGSIVKLNCEGESSRIVSDDKYRPYRQVESFNEPEEVNQRNVPPPELAESDIVPMVGVVAPVRVKEAPVAARAIVVRPVDRGTYRKRQLTHFGLEYPLHADEGNAHAVDLEAVLENLPGKDVVVFCNPFGKPAESGTANVCVTH